MYIKKNLFNIFQFIIVGYLRDGKFHGVAIWFNCDFIIIYLRDGKFDGVAIWFTCDFKPYLYDEELADKLK